MFGVSATPVFRPTARVIVLDPDDRVLLFSFDDPRGPRSWLTPGGGLRRGEAPAAGAARELAEETGFIIAPEDAGPVVATYGGRWKTDDGMLFFAADWFYCVKVPEAAVSTDDQEALERSIITGYRWWTVGELLETTDHIVPPGLADLVAQLLENGIPGLPVQFPWRALV